MQLELTQRDELIVQIQNDSLKTIDALDREIDGLKLERERMINDRLNI